MTEFGQSALEAPQATREAEFEAELFENGTMPRMTIETFIEVIGRYDSVSGKQLFELLARDVEEFGAADEWNAEFSGQIPKPWLHAALIENDVRYAGAYDLVLAPTLAHAVAVHPNKTLLAALAYWQPLNARHAAQVLRTLKDGPLEDYWRQAPLDEPTFLERQKAHGTPDEVIEEARLLADNPDAPPLSLKDYQKIDVAQQPDYVVRGLARELGMQEDMVRRLVPAGVDYLISRRKVGHNDCLDLDGILSDLDGLEHRDPPKTDTVVSLIKRGPASISALLVMSVANSQTRREAYDNAERVLHIDFPFPELRDSRDIYEKVVRTVAERGLFGTDQMGHEMVEEAQRSQPQIIENLCSDDRIDSELLGQLYNRTRMPKHELLSLLHRSEDIGRQLFGIEKYKFTDSGYY